jgi:hypothetical protein
MWWPPALDALIVVLFVVIGRETHDEENAVVAILETAAPFLIGLAAGWTVGRTRRTPLSAVAGFIVLVATLVIGMALRKAVFGDGTAVSFVVVASLFLGAGLLGWRMVWSRIGPPAVRDQADSL